MGSEHAVHHSLPLNVHCCCHICMPHHLLLNTDCSSYRIEPAAEGVPERMPAEPWHSDFGGQGRKMTAKQNAGVIRPARNDAREHPTFCREWRDSLPPQNEGQGAIGYNSAHARVRQRFTISHEIAHYLLHARKSGKAQLFIDKQVTYRRDDQSSAGVNREEIEANQLGAALLMPRGLVQQEIRARDLDLDDSEAIDLLAKRFQVSTAAMSNSAGTRK